MMPKTFTLAGLFCALFIFNTPGLSDNSLSSALVNDPIPTVYFDFEGCQSFLDGSHADYSEFIPLYEHNPLCSQFTVIGGHLYRSDADLNTHSCAPGSSSSTAMCVSSSDSCVYDSTDTKAIKFDLQLVPGPDGLGSIQEIRFDQRAPEQFSFIEGPTGLNNYPTLFTIRILRDGEEIFRQQDVPTSLDWSTEIFSFNGRPKFIANDTAVYNIEILPYCLIGNGASMNAFDIDNLLITGGCHNIRGGYIQTQSETFICAQTEMDQTVEFTVQNHLGPESEWVVVNSMNEIVMISDSSIIDFTPFESDTYSVYHISYLDQLLGYSVGSDLNDIQGCYELSNSIEITLFKTSGGELTIDDGTTSIDVCTGDGEDDIVDLELQGAGEDSILYVITDEAGLILDFSDLPAFNFENAGSGICLIYAINFSGDLNGLEIGNALDSVEGCFGISTHVTVNRQSFNGGQIETEGGQTSVNTCSGDGEQDLVNLIVSGESGPLNKWIITDTTGMILEISDNSTFDFENAGSGICLIWHVSYGDSSLFTSIDENLFLISACFDLSNSVSILREEVSGGEISIENSKELTICPSDDVTEVHVELLNAAGDSTAFILTDLDSSILEIYYSDTLDLSGILPGEYFLYNISYSTGLTGLQTGSDINQLSGCYDLSNSININALDIDGGNIFIEGGSTEFEVCSGDGEADILEVMINNAAGPFMVFLVTDTTGNVLDISESNSIDFENAGTGICQVWNISFTDSLTISGNDLNVNTLEGCYNLSNAITILREEVDGGEIEINGSQAFTLCPSDDVSSIPVSVSNAVGDSTVLVLTDTNDTIVALYNTDTLDFSTLATGEYELWNISFSYGITGLEAGQDINQLAGCYDFSNSVSITNLDIEGGTIELEGGLTEIDICSGDGLEDGLEIIVNNSSGPSMLFLVTDTTGLVLDISESNSIDFEEAGAGVCQVWHISFTDSMTIAGNDLNINMLEGCYDLSNAITVNRTEVNGGDIQTTDSLTTVEFVVGDSLPDLVDLILENAIGDTMVWIITDTSGIILSLPDTLPVDFENAGSGICQIWNLSYSGTITGLEVGEDIDTLVGCYDLSNPVSIIRSILVGGSIMTSDSLLAIDLCVGDGMPDIIDFILEGNEGDSSAWVVTDTLGQILALPGIGQVDFEGSGGGVCQVWHLSYNTGLVGLNVGENTSDLSGAFSFSNSVLINRTSVNGGSIMTSDSLTMVTACSGDMQSDIIDLISNGVEGDTSQWIVTDTSGIILSLPDTSSLNFEGVEEGICQVWNIGYSGIVSGLEIDSSLSSIIGCFDLSNAVTIERFEVEGGNLLTDTGVDSISIIAGDGISDLFDVVLTDTVGAFSDWIITNPAGTIIGIPPGPPFDLETAGGGVCQIWHISSSEDLMLEFGDELNDIVACHDLSNPITVTRFGLNGGILADTNAQDSVELCIVDSMVDSLHVMLMDTTGSFYSWAITDTAGVILDIPSSDPFDFSNAGPGICLIYHIAHEDNLTGLEVDSLISDLGGTFDLSNALTVIRSSVDGGQIMTTDSLTEITFLVGDGVSDIMNAQVENVVGDSSVWLVTDSMGIIILLTNSPEFNFDTIAPGICQVWHLSYSGMISGLDAGNPVNQLDGCYDLSNPITVTKFGLNGGILTTINLQTSTELCVGDGVDEPIQTVLSDTLGMNFEWLITDTFGLILAVPPGPPFNLEPAGQGVCQIWHMAYEAGLTGDTINGNIDSLVGVYDLSNALTVFRNEVNGGDLMTTDSLAQISIEVGEGIDDTISVILNNVIADSSFWVITDTFGLILDLPVQPPFLLEGAGSGVCQIWHLGSLSVVTDLEVGETLDGLSGCYDLSNPITVIRTEVNGGVLTDPEGETSVSFCTSDMEDDSLEVILTDTMGTVSDWIIADLLGNILELPDGPPFTFESFTQDVLELYHISSTGNLMGLMVGENLANLSGGFNFSNPIEIILNETAGGNLMTIDNLTEITIEVGEGINDTIDVILTGNLGDSTAYVLTDTLGSIRALPGDPPFLFEDQGAGVCQLWAVSYATGLSGLEIDSSIMNLEGCFDISNAITIIKEGVNGGILTTLDGLTEVTVCIGDGENDNIQTMLVDTVGMNSDWILTNSSNMIMGVPIGPPFNFENAPVLGNTLIWHLSWDSISPIPSNALIGQNIDVFGGNFDFSNPLTIIKDEVDGGVITTNDPTTIVVGDGIIDSIHVSLANAVGDSSVFLVLDNIGFIQQIQNDTVITFNNEPPGVCDIVHLSFVPGLTGLQVGLDVGFLAGCFDFSDPIEITKQTIQQISVSDSNEFDYTIYPQPAVDHLNFEFRKLPQSSGELYVYNREGKMIGKHDITQRNLRLDIDEYHPGLYYIRIKSGSIFKSDKMIIVK